MAAAALSSKRPVNRRWGTRSATGTATRRSSASSAVTAKRLRTAEASPWTAALAALMELSSRAGAARGPTRARRNSTTSRAADPCFPYHEGTRCQLGGTDRAADDGPGDGRVPMTTASSSTPTWRDRTSPGTCSPPVKDTLAWPREARVRGLGRVAHLQGHGDPRRSSLEGHRPGRQQVIGHRHAGDNAQANPPARAHSAPTRTMRVSAASMTGRPSRPPPSRWGELWSESLSHPGVTLGSVREEQRGREVGVGADVR